jgi:hypothetical protein
MVLADRHTYTAFLNVYGVEGALSAHSNRDLAAVCRDLSSDRGGKQRRRDRGRTCVETELV